MSILIHNLTKKAGSQTILSNISMEASAGNVVGFLGPNGAGKTTTMRIICGALPYQSGSVQVCGMEVKNNLLKIKSLTGYLPEHNPLYPDMYVREYLNFAADIYHIENKRQTIENLIDTVGLRQEAAKRIGQLSKGYRQRVGLAQALIHNPKVLVLDEPTTGLDPNQLEEIRSLIRELGRDRTVLLSTHIMQEIREICNQVIIINAGKIAADFSDLNKLSESDGEKQSFEVEFCKEIDMTMLQKIDNLKINYNSGNRIFKIVSDTDIREKIFDFAVNADNKLLTIKKTNRTIEEIFRNLTQNPQ
ncbi:MAG: ATP-binding cassette domain-containing protein [Prevotellaceae bacterium]|jgi:ABC-2 type transport system ATP-binding protein|nr:ATP-binding cassette domain-containing protein [Prevotellaceae bacterium]